jgi:hypothetical protein
MSRQIVIEIDRVMNSDDVESLAERLFDANPILAIDLMRSIGLVGMDRRGEYLEDLVD